MVYATKCRHTDKKHAAKGLCSSCYTWQWMKENTDHLAVLHQWREKNPDKYRKHIRNFRLKKHGLTTEDYQEMWEAQGGKCANLRCNFRAELNITDYRIGLHVDHDHKTDEVRGLLCPGCNTALGHAKDNIEILKGLIEYLEAMN